jgi:hypothetical protein
MSWGTATLFKGQMLASPASIFSNGIPLYPDDLESANGSYTKSTICRLQRGVPFRLEGPRRNPRDKHTSRSIMP